MTNDPKDSPVNEWETTDNTWVAHYPNATGDLVGRKITLDLQAALMNIRHEINYINSIAGSPGYVADGCQHALDYLSTADDAAAKLGKMLERE